MTEQQNISWYVLIGTQKYGPYPYKKMIEMIQQNQLMDYNYAWNETLDHWTPLYQLEDFSSDRFQLLLKNENDLSQAFIPRKNPRIEKRLPLMGHNSIRFFDGELVSLSENGALCLMNTPLLQVADQVKLHFQLNGIDEKSFNVEAVIVRKNFTRQRLNAKSGLYYAIRFTQMQSHGLEQIKNWVLNAAS